MDGIITVRATNVRGTEKTDVQIRRTDKTDWRGINDEDGVDVVGKLLPREKQYEIRNKVTELLEQELTDWRRIKAYSL